MYVDGGLDGIHMDAHDGWNTKLLSPSLPFPETDKNFNQVWKKFQPLRTVCLLAPSDERIVGSVVFHSGISPEEIWREIFVLWSGVEKYPNTVCGDLVSGEKKSLS